MEPIELRGNLERAFAGLMDDGFHPRLHALAGALPRYAHRVMAFRAAVSVAFADGRLADEEFGLLREMQKVLGITETDVARSFELAQGGGAGLPFDAEPVETYLDCLLMAAAADQKLEDEELATLIAFVVERDEFDGVPEEHIRGYMQVSLRAYVHGGIEGRLVTLLDELPTPEQRETAYGLAASMCIADGEVADAERAFLADLADALELEEARAALVLQSVVSD